MSFIIGSIVSAPSVAAPTGGAALLAEQVAEIKWIIQSMQDELNNLHVPWGNVTGKPVGFANATNLGGIFQNSTSTVTEPCDVGDVVTWNGTHWVCDDIGTGLPSNIVVLHYEQRGLVTVPSTTVLPDLNELTVWKILKDADFAHDASTVLYDSSVYANINGDIDIGWYKSKDGTIWKVIDDISAFTSTLVVEEEFGFQLSFSSEINYIAFGTANSGGTSAGQVKDFSGTITIHLPPGQSLMKLP